MSPIMKQNKRKGSTLPVCWLLIFVGATFLLIRMSSGQPQVYFKGHRPSDGPLIRSLPRIGRRSDLDPLPPNTVIYFEEDDTVEPENLFYWENKYRKYYGQGQQERNKNRAMGDGRGFVGLATSLGQLAPQAHPFLWKKFIADPPDSQSSHDDNGNEGGGSGDTNENDVHL